MGVPIVIQGVSMGGAIAINAFGQLEDIDGLIAASAYSNNIRACAMEIVNTEIIYA